MATSTVVRKATTPRARPPRACAVDASGSQALVLVSAVGGGGITALRLVRVRSTEGLSRPRRDRDLRARRPR